MNPETKVKDAMLTILSDRAKYLTTLNYAVSYCQAGLALHGNELRVQCLYILNNITGWRHPEGKQVRKTLKEFKG